MEPIRKIPRCIGACGAALLFAALTLPLPADLVRAKFFPDDPIWSYPPPRNVESVNSRKLSDYYEFLIYPFLPPGELNGKKPRDGGDKPVY